MTFDNYMRNDHYDYDHDPCCSNAWQKFYSYPVRSLKCQLSNGMPELPCNVLLAKDRQTILKSLYFTISTTGCETKLRTGYCLTYHRDLSDAFLTRSYGHIKCYRNVTHSRLSITKIQENMISDSKFLVDVYEDVSSNDLNIYVGSSELHTEAGMNTEIFYYNRCYLHHN